MTQENDPNKQEQVVVENTPKPFDPKDEARIAELNAKFEHPKQSDINYTDGRLTEARQKYESETEDNVKAYNENIFKQAVNFDDITKMDAMMMDAKKEDDLRDEQIKIQKNREDAQNKATESADSRNKRRPLLQKMFGKKITAEDVLTEQAQNEDKYYHSNGKNGVRPMLSMYEPHTNMSYLKKLFGFKDKTKDTVIYKKN